MSSTTRENDGRRARHTPPVGSERRLGIAPDDIDYYIRRGRHLRAETLAMFGRRIGSALGGAVSRLFRAASGRSGRADDELSVLAGRLRSPLASIRSSAEILRDNTDIDPAERRRFLSIVLAEEARLEALVSAMLDGSSVERRRGIWQVPLKHLRPRDQERALCSP